MPENNNLAQFVEWFRYSSPYINAHRGKTLVILFDGDAVDDANFPNLIHDIALLDSLGIRLVLVHGARYQIEKRLESANLKSNIVNNLRITDEATLQCVKEAVGSVRMHIEAMLSMGVANSPMAGAKIRVVSGNFVVAKPIGVHEGVDYCFTGEVRRIDASAIQHQLDDNSIVLLSSIGYSPTGEIFSLSAEDVATKAAIALNADKFIYLTEDLELRDTQGEVISQFSLSQAKTYVDSKHTELNENTRRSLSSAIDVCTKGVRRAHIVDRHVQGALLLELYTRNGIGTLVTADCYDTTRQANIDDVAGIIELIEPLEKEGILVRRSRERLEIEIDHFTVMERDGMIIACSALYPYGNTAELACLAVHKDYRNGQRGETLLSYTEKKALQLNVEQLFVLSSKTAHWFIERGFEASTIDALPVERQKMYNYQRRSKVFTKQLSIKR